MERSARSTAAATVPPGAQHAQREGLGYRPGLDGLRAFAILSVMAGHTWEWLFPGAFIGVDLFFVLSGFLITTLLLEERARTGRIALRLFYARRALRLLPALVAFLAAASLWIVLSPDSQLRHDSIHGLPAVVLYVANWVWGVFHIDLGMFGHMWSLSLEEQFYLIWPAVLIGVFAFRRRKGDAANIALIACLGAIVAAFALRWRISHLNPSDDSLRRLLNLRGDVLLVGCALALTAWRGWLDKIPGWAWSIATGLSLAGLGYFTFAPDRGFRDLRFYEGGFTLVAVAAAVLIVRVVHVPSRPLLAVVATPALVWIGRISYALYLWHSPIRDVLDDWLGTNPLRALVVWPLAFAAAILSYRFIERPALRYKDRLIPKAPKAAKAAKPLSALARAAHEGARPA